MTADSYILSMIFKEEFREPKHLATMIARSSSGLSDRAKQVTDWGAITHGIRVYSDIC